MATHSEGLRSQGEMGWMRSGQDLESTLILKHSADSGCLHATGFDAACESVKWAASQQMVANLQTLQRDRHDRS